jgi:phasin family protein
MIESTNQKSRTTDRPAQATKDFAQQGVDYSKNLAEKSQAAGKSLQQSYSIAASGAVEFNAQWIEMVRENTNASLDFAQSLLAVKSPSEFFELSAAHTRKQMETFAQQAQHLAGLAQKATTDAVKPMQVGMKSAFDKAA